MTQKKSNQVINNNPNLQSEILKRMSILPQGATIEQLTKTVKESQNVSVLDSTLQTVLTIPANSTSSLVNRLTNMNNERLADDYFFKIHDVCGYKRFANKEHRDDFEAINIQVKESYMAEGGNFWNGIVNILAGRSPGENGLFRTLLGGFLNKITHREDNKPGTY